MSKIAQRSSVVIALVFSALCAQSALAAPGEQILPSTTKGYLSIPDWHQFLEKWDETKLGELSVDPVMKPFVDDFREQMNQSLGRTGFRFGMGWRQISDVCSGEICLGMIEPANGKQKQALVAIVDVAGKDEAVAKLLTSIDETLKRRQADLEKKQAGDTELLIYSIPVKRGSRKRFTAVIFRHAGKLVAVDHEEIAIDILNRLDQPTEENLAAVGAFKATMDRCEKDTDNKPLLRWFIEPLGYARAARESVGRTRKRRGNDIIQSFENQGFGALQGFGGHLRLATDGHELVGHAFVYVPQNADGTRFKLAAKMINSLGVVNPAVPNWVPENVNGYHVSSIDIAKAYEYVGTLVDEVSGEEGFFVDLIRTIETDPQGPQIRVQQDLIDHLGSRVIMISDCVVPVVPESERMLVAFELKSPAAMAQTIHRIMEQDPNARKRTVDGKVIWEIIGEDDEEIPTVVIDGSNDFGDFGGFGDDDQDDAAGFLEMTNAAVAVVDDYLMVTNQVDFIAQLITQPKPQDLATSAEFELVENALKKLGSGQDCLRSFVRVDEVVRASYELIRTGRMPESRGVIGLVLNKLLASEEKGVARQQRIDGKNLPEFQVVRRYLGPGGAFLRPEADGWFLVLVGLNKDAEAADPAVAQSRTPSEFVETANTVDAAGN